MNKIEEVFNRLDEEYRKSGEKSVFEFFKKLLVGEDGNSISSILLKKVNNTTAEKNIKILEDIIFIGEKLFKDLEKESSNNQEIVSNLLSMYIEQKERGSVLENVKSDNVLELGFLHQELEDYSISKVEVKDKKHLKFDNFYVNENECYYKKGFYFSENHKRIGV